MRRLPDCISVCIVILFVVSLPSLYSSELAYLEVRRSVALNRYDAVSERGTQLLMAEPGSVSRQDFERHLSEAGSLLTFLGTLCDSYDAQITRVREIITGLEESAAKHTDTLLRENINDMIAQRQDQLNELKLHRLSSKEKHDQVQSQVVELQQYLQMLDTSSLLKSMETEQTGAQSGELVKGTDSALLDISYDEYLPEGLRIRVGQVIYKADDMPVTVKGGKRTAIELMVLSRNLYTLYHTFAEGSENELRLSFPLPLEPYRRAEQQYIPALVLPKEPEYLMEEKPVYREEISIDYDSKVANILTLVGALGGLIFFFADDSLTFEDPAIPVAIGGLTGAFLGGVLQPSVTLVENGYETDVEAVAYNTQERQRWLEEVERVKREHQRIVDEAAVRLERANEKIRQENTRRIKANELRDFVAITDVTNGSVRMIEDVFSTR
ncbi:MAG: hypothetical protein JXK93_07845 [Sphaerochaetaceae bacterium]|nr:hypothetical protein [Sphaerochaetaceae bacterium]